MFRISRRWVMRAKARVGTRNQHQIDWGVVNTIRHSSSSNHRCKHCEIINPVVDISVILLTLFPHGSHNLSGPSDAPIAPPASTALAKRVHQQKPWLTLKQTCKWPIFSAFPIKSREKLLSKLHTLVQMRDGGPGRRTAKAHTKNSINQITARTTNIPLAPSPVYPVGVVVSKRASFARWKIGKIGNKQWKRLQSLAGASCGRRSAITEQIDRELWASKWPWSLEVTRCRANGAATLSGMLTLFMNLFGGEICFELCRVEEGRCVFAAIKMEICFFYTRWKEDEWKR